MRTHLHQTRTARKALAGSGAPLLSDLGRPALVIGAEVRWMMTDGGENIRVCLPVDCLALLDGGTATATLDCFERHRPTLSCLAAAVYARRETDGSEPVRIEKDDIERVAA